MGFFMDDPIYQRWLKRSVYVPLVVLLLCFTGCYTPLRTFAIPANQLPDTYRMALRTCGKPLNYASLTQAPVFDYLLGPDDILEVTVPELYEGAVSTPIRVQVMPDGTITLPLIGGVYVEGLNLMRAQQEIVARYADGYLIQPRVMLFLAEKAKVKVLVLGKVAAPGVYELEKYQEDIAEALAAAGGLTEDAADVIELHRRIVEPRRSLPELRPLPRVHGDEAPSPSDLPSVGRSPANNTRKEVVRIPLRGVEDVTSVLSDLRLRPSDVIVVPERTQEVFFVVGRLSPTNRLLFTASARERELGNGFLLPRDREIDVLTAVAMAGYIDPIDSPNTVTVQRTMPDGRPLLILVDLIEARYDPQATVLVYPGDIIYLNPDAAWWLRRTFDRIVPELLTVPYRALFGFNF